MTDHSVDLRWDTYLEIADQGIVGERQCSFFGVFLICVKELLVIDPFLTGGSLLYTRTQVVHQLEQFLGLVYLGCHAVVTFSMIVTMSSTSASVPRKSSWGIQVLGS